MTGQLTEYQRKAQSQRSVQNALLAANAVGQLIQVHQTSKLKNAVNSLEGEVINQTSILRNISSTQKNIEKAQKDIVAVQSEILDETTKQTKLIKLNLDQTMAQTKLMELNASKLLLDRASKQAVFEFKIQVEKIESMSTNIEKYFSAESCLSSLINCDLKLEDLPSIEDKEYFHKSMERLKSLSLDALSNLKPDENQDLVDLKQWLDKILEVKQLKSNTQKLIDDRKKLDNSLELDIKNIKKSVNRDNENSKTRLEMEVPKKFKLVSKYEKRLITYGLSVGSFILGFVGFGLIDPMGSYNNYPVGFSLLCMLFILFGLFGFIWRFTSGIFSLATFKGKKRKQDEEIEQYKAKRFAEIQQTGSEKYKELKLSLEQKHSEVKLNLEVEFYKSLQELNLDIDEEISIDNANDIVKLYLTKINKNFSSIMKKYPALKVNSKFSLS